MILQRLTYKCDSPKCTTPPIEDEMPVSMHGPTRRPCAPNGWLWLEAFGMLCSTCNGKLTEIHAKFFQV